MFDVCLYSAFLDGLEVRVAFGGVWKESLTELSVRRPAAAAAQVDEHISLRPPRVETPLDFSTC